MQPAISTHLLQHVLVTRNVAKVESFSRTLVILPQKLAMPFCSGDQPKRSMISTAMWVLHLPDRSPAPPFPLHICRGRF